MYLPADNNFRCSYPSWTCYCHACLIIQLISSLLPPARCCQSKFIWLFIICIAGVPSGYLTPPISNPAPSGYSPAHASYASERIAWQDASIRGKAPRLTKQLLAILVDIYYEVKDQSTDIMDEDPTVCHQFLITYMLPRLTI